MHANVRVSMLASVCVCVTVCVCACELTWFCVLPAYGFVQATQCLCVLARAVLCVRGAPPPRGNAYVQCMRTVAVASTTLRHDVTHKGAALLISPIHVPEIGPCTMPHGIPHQVDLPWG